MGTELKEDFWQGMKAAQIIREKGDLIVCDEKNRFPLGPRFILECSSTDYSKDIKLEKNSVDPKFLEKIILGQNVLLGMRYSKEQNRYEAIQIALMTGWCWDEV